MGSITIRNLHQYHHYTNTTAITKSTKGQACTAEGVMRAKDNSADPGIDCRIILKQILEGKGGRMQTGCIWLRKDTGNILPGSVKGGEFLV
jgi:hypothetical protein